MANETPFLGVVEKLYDAALNDDPWSSTLDDMADLFGSVGVSFELIDKKTSRPVFIDLGTRLNLEGVSKDYIQYYGAISPRVQRGIKLPAGSITCDYDIITEAEIDRDEFYNELKASNGLRYFVSGHILHTASHLAVIAAQRSPSQGHVDDAEIRTMERLLPHVQQALDIKFRLAAAHQTSQSAFNALEILEEGCLFVDRSGKILHTNQQADKIISSVDGIDVVGGYLTFSDNAAANLYAQALHSLTREDEDSVGMAESSFQAGRSSGTRPYLISIRQLPASRDINPYISQAAAIVFIRNPDQFARLDLQLLRQSFNLTVAETDLAGYLDQGLSLSDVARLREVSITTVRSQLYAVMAKTAVNKQTDLIRLLTQFRKPFS